MNPGFKLFYQDLTDELEEGREGQLFNLLNQHICCVRNGRSKTRNDFFFQNVSCLWANNEKGEREWRLTTIRWKTPFGQQLWDKKNWLFMGDAEAEERGAIIYTVIESYRRRVTRRLRSETMPDFADRHGVNARSGHF
jgi:hypothetical protein